MRSNRSETRIDLGSLGCGFGGGGGRGKREERSEPDWRPRRTGLWGEETGRRRVAVPERETPCRSGPGGEETGRRRVGVPERESVKAGLLTGRIEASIPNATCSCPVF